MRQEGMLEAAVEEVKNCLRLTGRRLLATKILS
jgi:hypothetical protein